MSAWQSMTRGDWGQVRFGRRAYPTRLVVTIAGIAVWLGLTLVRTGTGGVAAVWTNLLFLIPLLVLCGATRTVSGRQLLSLCLIGGFMMGVALTVINAVAPAPGTAARAFVVPVIEETCKVAPVLFLLWRWRASRIFTLAATDVLLMAAACGAGFGVVEDAYIRSRFGWPDHLAWLPVTEITGGRIIAGHAIWTALAGLTIGLGLMLRRHTPLAVAVAASGFFLSAFDHISNNYGAGSSGGLATTMNTIGMHGYLVLTVFLVAAPAAITADWLIGRVALPDLPELSRPGGMSDPEVSVTFSVNRRAMAHALFNSRQTAGLPRAQAIRAAAALDAWFMQTRFAAEVADADG
jgi:RsiW-degrading membrane proteinase PrsW (M82 family)